MRSHQGIKPNSPCIYRPGSLLQLYPSVQFLSYLVLFVNIYIRTHHIGGLIEGVIELDEGFKREYQNNNGGNTLSERFPYRWIAGTKDNDIYLYSSLPTKYQQQQRHLAANPIITRLSHCLCFRFCGNAALPVASGRYSIHGRPLPKLRPRIFFAPA